MTASRVAVLAATTSLLAWGAKAVAIWVAGGLDQSPLEDPLFLLGLTAMVVAFASLGVAVAGRRPLGVKVLGGVVGVVIGAGLSAVSALVATAVVPESAGWVQGEAGLWISALVALGMTATWHATRGAERAGA